VLVHSSLEPGSTIKPLLAAYALDRGWLNEAKRYVCNRYLTVDGYTIREAEASHLVGDSNGVGIEKIIAKSSNIGMAQIAMELGQHRVMEAYESLGFFERSGIELPAEEKGIRPFYYEQKRSRKELRWPRITLANTGFGQGMCVTPVQLASAYCVIANGGYLVQPTLLREIGAREGEPETPEQNGEEAAPAPQDQPGDAGSAEVMIGSAKPRAESMLAAYHSPEDAELSYDPRPRVLSEHTCSTVTAWLQSAVEDGTGKRAKLSRFKAAGKTGTAQIAGNGGYQKGAYMASFAGFFPVEQPRYVILVLVINPKTGKYYGGDVAAPVFKSVGDRISFLDQIETLGASHAD
jgi:cell division protein FtsI/penicillin-binding protein 2